MLLSSFFHLFFSFPSFHPFSLPPFLFTFFCMNLHNKMYSMEFLHNIFIVSLRWPTLMAEREEELKSFLMKVKEESEKAGLKLNIRKTKIIASSPIILWQIDGETMEIVTDFIFLGFKITMDRDCSHKIKRHLFLGRKAVTNLDSVLKSTGITLPIKVCIVKATVLSVVTYGGGGP